MADILSIISLVSFILASVCFVLAIVFWFGFKIPTVIGDLSGRTARKSIAKIRESNEKSGAKSYRPSTVNAERGKLTSNMPDFQKVTGNIPNTSPVVQKKQEVVTEGQRLETGLLSENKVDARDVQQTEATGLLNEDDATTLLVATPVPEVPKRTGGKNLVMLEEIILIHTDEVI